MKKRKPIELDNIRTYPLKSRESKVNVDDFAEPWQTGGRMARWISSLPDILAAKDFKEIVTNVADAVRNKKMVILAMGAHAVKVGLNPVIIDLMDRGIIKALALNGAGIIHDSEVAMVGRTSEDVAANIGTGDFGMAEETGSFINRAINEGSKNGLGLGGAVGDMLLKEDFPYNRFSILANAYKMDIPVTVHVAIGTDIIHLHPEVDPAAIGRTSHLDFRIFAELVSRLEGGVFINLGSAVILPEVFLKAVTLARNLGNEVRNITTVDMDFIRNYRPMTNVVHRPTLEGGKGYSITGHHEIMFPLLAAAIIEGLD